jgi:hypothetical protein
MKIECSLKEFAIPNNVKCNSLDKKTWGQGDKETWGQGED